MPAPELITHLILHTTAGSWGSVESIRRQHTTERNPPWADIGYHYLVGNPFPTFETWKHKRPSIENDGKLFPGRDLDHDGDVDEEIGAHAIGWNGRSIGIAYVGEGGHITGAQLHEMLSLCRDLCHRYRIPFKNVIGHYETGANKTCPDLDMDHFRELLGLLQ